MKQEESVEYAGLHCTIAIQYPAAGVVVLRISGRDVGEFGQAPMEALAQHLSDDATTTLFIDARATEGASIEVSHAWARWLSAHRAHFEQVSMLTGSRYIQITADFVRRFADLGDVMRLYTDAAAFDEAVAAAIAAAR